MAINKSPIDGNTFWLNIKGLDIEIIYTIYETHTYASASYYYWDEDSIIGTHTQNIKRAGVNVYIRKAIKGAILELFREINEQGLTIWHTKRPDTNEDARIVFFTP